MAETATKPVTLHAAADPDTDGKDGGGDRMGRALDIAGIAAAIVLGVIIFDVISGGKVTKLFRRKRGGCECWGDNDPGPGNDG